MGIYKNLFNYEELQELDKSLNEKNKSYKDQIIQLNKNNIESKEEYKNIDNIENVYLDSEQKYELKQDYKKTIGIRDLNIKGYDSITKVLDISTKEISDVINKGEDHIGSGYKLKNPIINGYFDEQKQNKDFAYRVSEFFEVNSRIDYIDPVGRIIDITPELTEVVNSLEKISNEVSKRSEKENTKEDQKIITKTDTKQEESEYVSTKKPVGRSL